MQTVADSHVVLDYPWSASIGFFAAAIAGVLLMLGGRSLIRKHPLNLVSAIILLLITLWSGAYFATWSARLDGEGIAVRAPFDIWRRQGVVAWRDATSIAIGGRRSFYQLRLVSRDGTTADIALQSLPKHAVRPFAAAITQRTKHVHDRQRDRDYALLTHRAARPGRSIATLRVRPLPLQLAQLKPQGSP